ncbi:leucine-rich repeat protein SHOC-2 [Cylas formicarius]|uniref:leucine-rich repeat protein SHOC-2 n=1 Tax=Cylas formicarius TaxID=197179 RepID=UPI0029585838|nr:leucine-rich repeat protein SHOC-2 [Cylas formicarius]
MPDMKHFDKRARKSETESVLRRFLSVSGTRKIVRFAVFRCFFIPPSEFSLAHWKQRKIMRPPSQYPQAVVGAEAETEEPDPRLMAMMISTRLAGRAVIRVVGRCNEAQENQELDLSNCQLMQVPDAVYHLMRHTELKTCDLSDNVITKIPPKFAVKFNLITDLNLSHNQMSKLPEECAEMGSLERLDISHNTFTSLPTCIFKMPKLNQLNANDNHIVDIEVDFLEEAPSLQNIDLTRNPITPRIHDQLSRITKIRISLSPREKEDWEDLTI